MLSCLSAEKGAAEGKFSVEFHKIICSGDFSLATFFWWLQKKVVISYLAIS
jgi:hypothetical protein